MNVLNAFYLYYLGIIPHPHHRERTHAMSDAIVQDELDEIEELDSDAATDETDELDDLELDEVEDADEESDAEEAEVPQKRTRRTAKKAAAKKPAAPKKDAIEFGTAQLLAHIEAETGKLYDGRALRVLLRKMTADGQLVREHGQRYEFTGPEDPKVEKIIERIKGGEIEAAQTAALEKLKKDSEARRAAKKAEKEAKAAAEASDEVEDEDGEEEVEEAPAKKAAPRRATTRRKAPARKKATDVAEADEDDE